MRQMDEDRSLPLHYLRGGVLGFVALLIFLSILESVTIVNPSQVACFRTFGNPDCGPEITVALDQMAPDKSGRMTHHYVAVRSHRYYGQGLHFVFPWITTVDKIQVSQRLTDLHTVRLTLGQQNQPAEVDYRMLVDVPVHGMIRPDGTYVDSVYHLMYQLGSAGSSDVNAIVDNVADAGLNSGFAPIEPDNISARRNQTIATVSANVAADLAQLGVQMPAGSQIKVARLELEGAWKDAANMRVRSIGIKNAAENEAEADRLRGLGKGEAEQAEAEGHAKAVDAKAKADAAYISQMRAAFGGNDNALSIFMITQSRTALPQVLGVQGVQVVPAPR